MAMDRAELLRRTNTYDLDTWDQLIKENKLKRIEDARDLYELMIDRFPLSGRFWKIYIEHEIQAKEYDRAEKLFNRCLTKVLNLDLWKCYLKYVKENRGNQPKYYERMGHAYDYALDKIGMDHMSYSIWNDYVNHLKNFEVVGSFAENQKITAVRKAFQKGVINPMMNIEQFWKDYVAYEQSINKLIADKMIQDRSRDYMNARRVAKEYEVITRGLNRNAPALPPSTDLEQSKQVELWRKYLAWEKSNPLRLEDPAQVIERVVFAYEQCLLCLGHYPDMWHEYASYLNESGHRNAEKGDLKKYQDQAAAIYARATSTLLKTNLLLHFAWADFEEGRNKKDTANEIYDNLLKVVELDPTLVFVQYMKFSRRAEGIKQARLVFKRAREDNRSGHQVYCAAALMEYYCTKDKNVACKIFELGLKKYPAEKGYILSYLDFLSHLNEENNTRVLFERILTSGSLTPDDQLDIWNKFLEFESNIGDLASITKVERRRATALEKVEKKESETCWLVDRYKFNDLYPLSMSELRAAGYKKNLTALDSRLTSEAANVEDNTIKQTPKPKPNLTQMLPFKPVKDSRTALHTHRVTGGIFPPPPAIGQLLSVLPHPSCFRGPFVSINELMSLFQLTDLSNQRPEGLAHDRNGTKLFDTAMKASANFGNNNHDQQHNHGGHRRHGRGPPVPDDDDDEGDNSNSNSAAAFDIYRSRQMSKRMKI